MAIARGRHTSYTTAGLPVITEMPSQTCFIDELLNFDFLGTRQIGYSAAGIPITATALTCCDKFDKCDRVEVAGTSPPLPNGVDRHLRLYIRDTGGCPSLHPVAKQVDLTYVSPLGPFGSPGDPCYIPLAVDGPDIPGCHTCNDPTKGKWVGSVSMPGGTVNFELCYEPFLSSIHFILRWYGSCGEGCHDGLFSCGDPLIIFFGPSIDFSDCCACSSTQPSTVSFLVVGNCRPTVNARHIGYTTSGVPIVATENCYADPPIGGCCSPQCDLTAIVSDVSGCACMAGTFNLVISTPGTTPIWAGGTGGIIGVDCHYVIGFSCTPEVIDGVATGYSTVCASVSSLGATTDEGPVPCGGIDCKRIRCGLADLDETFTINIVAGCVDLCIGTISIRVMSA